LDVNEHLRLALQALEQGAAEARTLATRSTGEMRDRINRTMEEVLEHLEADSADPDPEDLIDRFDRQAKGIADDLRRVERLMKQRLGKE